MSKLGGVDEAWPIHYIDTRPIRIEITEMKINWLADLADRTTVIVVADLFTKQLKSILFYLVFST